MSKRTIPTAALALALLWAPSTVGGQLATSVSLHMGLFDGVGVGLAASHWDAGSIFSPGFHFGFGVSAGLGMGVGMGVGMGGYQDYGHGYGGGGGYGYDYGWNSYGCGPAPAYDPYDCWDWESAVSAT